MALARDSQYPNFYRSGTARDLPRTGNTPIATSPGPLGTRSGLAQDSPYPNFYRSGTARDSPYPSFYRSGTAWDWPGTRRTPIFTGPGPPTPFGFYKIKSLKGGGDGTSVGAWDHQLWKGLSAEGAWDI